MPKILAERSPRPYAEGEGDGHEGSVYGRGGGTELYRDTPHSAGVAAMHCGGR
jgi:hypothetical protein